MTVKAKLFTTFCLMIGWTFVSAQTYPVQVSLAIIPPYSLHLSDYVTSNKLAVNVLFNDPVRFELSAKLKLTIEGKGITITTKPEFNPSPLFLQSGFPERLTGADLAPYFEARNLNFQGFDRREFERKGALPEGVYRICIEVFEHSQNRKVSNSACSAVWMILNDPPIINYPKNGEKIKIQEPQLVIFNWTPRHTGSPNAAFATEYDFELVEVRSNDRNPNNAMLTSPPIFTTTTQSTSLYYSIAETPLIPGQQYAFRVRAKAIAGLDELDLFKNRGYSEVYSFTYGDYCLSPDAIKIESSSPTTIKANWTPFPAHTAFTLRYKENKPKAEWFDKKIMVEESSIASLRPETEYLIQIVGHCGVVSAEEVKTYTVKTLKAEEKDFACGNTADQVDNSNTTLISKLSPGDFIEASNFKIALVEVVDNGGSTYSGRGVAYIPWFRLAGLKVEFKGIQVNEDKKIIKGNVVSIQSANSKWSWTPPVKDPSSGNTSGNTTGNTNSGNGGSDPLDPTNSTQSGTPVIISANNPTIGTNNDGQTVITDDKGNTTVLAPGQQATVVDSDGNEQVITGGGATAGGNNTGSGSTGDPSGNGGQTPNQNYSPELIQLLKNAIAKIKSDTDFSKMDFLKEELWLKRENLKGTISNERELLLRNTRSSVEKSSNEIILVYTEEIDKHDDMPWGPSTFNAYKEVEKNYNRLKALSVICQKNLKEEDLLLLAGHLKIEGQSVQQFADESKSNAIPEHQMVESIARSIINLVESKL